MKANSKVIEMQHVPALITQQLLAEERLLNAQLFKLRRIVTRKRREIHDLLQQAHVFEQGSHTAVLQTRSRRKPDGTTVEYAVVLVR